jgi:hypothetical protein
MSSPSLEEVPKRAATRRVITPKRKYFVPEHGTVEATDLSDVEKKLSKLKKDEKVGDGR